MLATPKKMHAEKKCMYSISSDSPTKNRMTIHGTTNVAISANSAVINLAVIN
jgi:hypothetical protein